MVIDVLPLHPDAFGLDLSDLSLKIARLKKTSQGNELVSFCNVPIQPGLIEQGEIKKEDELAQGIKAAILKVQGATLPPYVVASLPEEKAFLQVIQLPFMDAKDVQSAVNFELENYIPYPPETVYVDSKIVPSMAGGFNHIDVLLAALPRKTVDSYLALFQKAGLTPVVLEIESLALARTLIPRETSQFPTLIVDIGATRTSFIVFAGLSLRFTASIAISSASMTLAISKTMNIDQKNAEELKMRCGLKDRETIEGKQVFDALVPPIVDCKEQIKKYADYYEAHGAHEHLPIHERKIKKILLAGGGANLPGLKEFLEKELAVEVELGNPWVNIAPQPFKKLPPLPLSVALQYSTALGLALRGLHAYD